MTPAADVTSVGSVFLSALQCRTFGGSLAGSRVAGGTEA